MCRELGGGMSWWFLLALVCLFVSKTVSCKTLLRKCSKSVLKAAVA